MAFRDHRSEIAGFPSTVVERPGARAHTAEIEAEGRGATLHHRARQHVRDLVVHRPFEERMWMAGNAEDSRNGRRVVGELEPGFQRSDRTCDGKRLCARHGTL